MTNSIQDGRNPVGSIDRLEAEIADLKLLDPLRKSDQYERLQVAQQELQRRLDEAPLPSTLASQSA